MCNIYYQNINLFIFINIIIINNTNWLKKTSWTTKQLTNLNNENLKSPNTQLFGATYLGDENNKKRTQRQLDAPNLATQITQISPVGRYGARRPTCSMAEVFNY